MKNACANRLMKKERVIVRGMGKIECKEKTKEEYFI
jgi:hypothetical protein